MRSPVAFSPSGTTLATADFNGNTYLWTVGLCHIIWHSTSAFVVCLLVTVTIPAAWHA
jgi:hypothetical protein